MKENVNHRQIVFAREYRELSQSALASKIKGLSQSNLSKYEKGLGGLSDETINKIIRILDFPFKFFIENIYIDIENAHYRKKSTVSKKIINRIESDCKIVSKFVDEMGGAVEWPEFRFKTVDLDDGFTPEQVAKYTRGFLKLNSDTPVKNICRLLENNGIVIVEISANEKFDGLSLLTNKEGIPVIIINKHFSNDRKRFTIAHELGHLLMHNDLVSNFRNKENEANRFASEFLMPKEGISSCLSPYLRMSDLTRIKEYWLCSKASVLKRAKDLGRINQNRYKYLNIEMSRAGERKQEKGLVFIDKPTLFKDAYLIHLFDLNYSKKELSEALGLPFDSLDKFNPIDNNVKLRILR